MSSSLLFQKWPACLVRLTWIVFVIGGRWPYSWCLVGCCCQITTPDGIPLKLVDKFTNLGSSASSTEKDIDTRLTKAWRGCPRGVMVKAMDCGIVVREFVLQSRYYVHFRANTLGKVRTPLSSQLWVKFPHYCSSRRMALAFKTCNGWYAIKQRTKKAWTAIVRLSIIWKSDLTDKMKRSFFQAAVVSILLYGCSIWTLTKWLVKKLDGNYTRMLRAILNKLYIYIYIYIYTDKCIDLLFFEQCPMSNLIQEFDK